MSLERWIAPLKRRVMLMIGRAIITVVKDTTGMQTVQVDLGHDEKIDSVECVQNFGFSSHPKSGAQAVVVFIGGNRDHPLVIAADDRNFRPSLSSGESAMYNAFNAIVKLKNGVIEINTAKAVPLLVKDGVLTGNTVSPVTGALFSAVPANVSQKVRASHL